MGLGRNIRRYIYFATTTLLLFAAIATLIVRYRGRNCRLLQVIRRDGGAYYLALAAIRLGSAIVSTPGIVPPGKADGNPGVMLLNALGDTGIPILAQRLIINLRTVDYIGGQSVASKLMFAPHSPDAEDDTLYDGAGGSLEMDRVSPDLRSKERPSTPTGTRDDGLKV